MIFVLVTFGGGLLAFTLFGLFYRSDMRTTIEKRREIFAKSLKDTSPPKGYMCKEHNQLALDLFNSHKENV